MWDKDITGRPETHGDQGHYLEATMINRMYRDVLLYTLDSFVD